jgi:hypothetical protein
MKYIKEYQEHIKKITDTYISMLTCDDEDNIPLFRMYTVVDSVPDNDGVYMTKLLIAENIRENNAYALKWFIANMITFDQWKLLNAFKIDAENFYDE